jgi:hypothetical protein
MTGFYDSRQVNQFTCQTDVPDRAALVITNDGEQLICTIK